MIPKYWMLMLPILKICHSDQNIHRKDLSKKLIKEFELSQEEQNQLKASGGQTLFENRLGWASFYLKKAGLVDQKRGNILITEQGKEILKQNLEKIDKKFLQTIPAFQEFINTTKNKRDKAKNEDTTDDSEQSPEDTMISSYQTIRDSIENELIEKIKKNTPEFFESLVLELVRKMGYGVDHKVLGRTGDGGIDGWIKEDKLGFDEIHFQAKRWIGTVPISAVRDFAGALMTKKSKRGIFITSSNFSNDARDFVNNIDAKIILIDGDRLAEYMYDYDLGVSVADVYNVKKINDDYFSDE